MKSMTGFGKASVSDEHHELTVEIRSVNNRYLEMAIRMPKEFAILENKVRGWIKSQVFRGKLNVFITVSISHPDTEQSIIEPDLAQQLYQELARIKEKLNIEQPVSLQDLLNYHALADTNGIKMELETFEAMLKPATDKALEQLNLMRGTEGNHLLEDMSFRLQLIQELTDSVSEMGGKNVQKVFDKMVQNIEDLIGAQKIDSSRLEQEIALISDKVDITEECVRMNSHLKLFNKTIKKSGEAGKKLTFILQEMLREANTMNSKNSDIEIQHQVIRIKEEIEKIREQAQNIE